MSLIWYHFMDKEQTSNTELEQLYRICPSCSFFCNKLEEDKFCSLCGSELIEECPTCKNSISNPYANYCKYCGESYPGRSSKGNSEGW